MIWLYDQERDLVAIDPEHPGQKIYILGGLVPGGKAWAMKELFERTKALLVMITKYKESN